MDEEFARIEVTAFHERHVGACAARIRFSPTAIAAFCRVTCGVDHRTVGRLS